MTDKMPPPGFGDLPKTRVPFGDRLSGLCVMELCACDSSPDRFGEMIERLLNSLAFTIAIAAKGNPKNMDELLRGAESYLYEAATSHQKAGQLLGGSMPPPRT